MSNSLKLILLFLFLFIALDFLAGCATESIRCPPTCICDEAGLLDWCDEWKELGEMPPPRPIAPEDDRQPKIKKVKKIKKTAEKKHGK